MFGVDIMGQGKACHEIGCDHTIATTLDSENDIQLDSLVKRAKKDGTEILIGNIFDKKDAGEIIRKVKSYVNNGEKCGVIFFRPFGGLYGYFNETYYDNTYAAIFLYKKIFEPLYKQLSQDGVMFIELSGLPLDYFDFFFETLDKSGIIIQRKEGKQIVRIEKTKDSPSSLPEFDFNEFTNYGR